MVVNATIHFHGQASPVGVWSFLRLPLTRRAVKKKNVAKIVRILLNFCKILTSIFREFPIFPKCCIFLKIGGKKGYGESPKAQGKKALFATQVVVGEGAPI